MKVREFLTDESKWTQDSLARDSEGNGLSKSNDPKATSWCLAGAIQYCYGTDWPRTYSRVDDYIVGFLSDQYEYEYDNLEDWNDAESTTFADVKALVEKLDI